MQSTSTLTVPAFTFPQPFPFKVVAVHLNRYSLVPLYPTPLQALRGIQGSLDVVSILKRLMIWGHEDKSKVMKIKKQEGVSGERTENLLIGYYVPYLGERILGSPNLSIMNIFMAQTHTCTS